MKSSFYERMLLNGNLSNFNNHTGFERTIPENVLAVFVLIIVILTALVGNTAVIAVICMYRNMRRDLSNMLLINLSVTDLANTLFVMVSALVSLIVDDWILGRAWCDCICAINYCLIIVSMLTLCCISLDRYQAIMHPLTYMSRVTRPKLVVVIIYVWIQGAVFGIAPSLVGWVDYDYWEAICAIQWHLYRPDSIVYVVVAFVLCFLGPGIILIYCYVKILQEAKKHKTHVTSSSFNDKANRKVSEKKRIVWSLLVVVLAYFICTTPFSLTKLIKVSAEDSRIVPGQINLASALLGYVASAINPLIYGIFRRDFRQAYIQLMKVILSGRRQSTLSTNSLDDVRRSAPSLSSEHQFRSVNLDSTIPRFSDAINMGNMEIIEENANMEHTQQNGCHQNGKDNHSFDINKNTESITDLGLTKETSEDESEIKIDVSQNSLNKLEINRKHSNNTHNNNVKTDQDTSITIGHTEGVVLTEKQNGTKNTTHKNGTKNLTINGTKNGLATPGLSDETHSEIALSCKMIVVKSIKKRVSFRNK